MTLIANIESDEILMNTCLSVASTDYYAVFQNGTKYKLKGQQYYTKLPDGRKRFDRKKAHAYIKQANIDEGAYTIVDEKNYEGKEQLAIFLLRKQIRKLYATLKCDICQFFLGPEDNSNFRFSRAFTQPYKHERPEKPPIRELLRNVLLNEYGAKVMYGYEADDALGIYQEKGTEFEIIDNNFMGIGKLTKAPQPKTIAVHQDKDINMIPGWHYNWKTNELWYTDELGKLWLNDKGAIKGAGLAWFYAQMLMGDKTDTIPSLKKGRYGDKTTHELLKDCKTEGDYLRDVVNEFKMIVGDSWQERLLEQADLVYIVRVEGEYGSDYIRSKLDE